MYSKDPKFLEAWEAFKEMRKKKKRPLTERAEKRQLTNVENLVEAGLSIDDLIDHLFEVCDRRWDNVYNNPEHLNNILAKYGHKSSINGTSKQQSARVGSQGSNFFTYHKGSAYDEAAANLLEATSGFDFVGRLGTV